MNKIRINASVDDLGLLTQIAPNTYKLYVQFLNETGGQLGHPNIPDNQVEVSVETTSNTFVVLVPTNGDFTGNINALVKLYGEPNTDCCIASGIFNLVGEEIPQTPARFEGWGFDGMGGDVWLPKNYHSSKRYAVIYANDGETLYDKDGYPLGSWKFDTRVQDLIDTGQIRECIVVSIRSNDRMRTLLPDKPFYAMPPADQATIASNNNGTPLGDSHLNWIINNLKPFVDANYSTKTDAENTVILGASMGGLFAAYAFGERSDVFGKAACVSTHWQATLIGVNDELFTGHMLNYVQNYFPAPSPFKKVYFDTGTESLDANYLAPQLQCDSIVAAKGYTSVNVKSIVDNGAGHDPTFWGPRVPGVLTFLIPK